MTSLRVPAATYRLQFSPEFGFAAARDIVPYLDQLGITHIYASPLLNPRMGSQHGYDVVDPSRLNPELGGEAGFKRLAAELKQKKMGLVLDIVPNHMAACGENKWWENVLQFGRLSIYAGYFDINWWPPRSELGGRVTLPVLGSPYGEALAAGHIKLKITPEGFKVSYYEQSYPVNPYSYDRILSRGWEELVAKIGAEHPSVILFGNLIQTFRELPPCRRALASAVEKLWQLYCNSSPVKEVIDAGLQYFNDGGDGTVALDRLLEEQPYRLVYWPVANREINYRRFFNINDKIGVRVEREYVFAATHALVASLAREGLINGFRIDHVDGLHDPKAYLHRLRHAVGEDGEETGFYIIVEKILSSGEDLPGDWPVHGTTGYDFLNLLNGIFVDQRGAAELLRLYAGLEETEVHFRTEVYKQKRRMTGDLFAGEMSSLAAQLCYLAAGDRQARDLTSQELHDALAEVTACLPVYRTYIRGFEVAERDRQYIEKAVSEAVNRCGEVARACSFLRRVLLMEFSTGMTIKEKNQWLDFVMRWQQYTGPVMAKGFEDTALYRYNPLVSLNEVGGNPARLGSGVEEFHRRNKYRQEHWPWTMNATSTHDTKRSEDVRARINVLSEIPELWAEKVSQWRKWNSVFKPVVDKNPVPDDNTELFLYQTLLGAWPLMESEVPDFIDRFKAYVIKAAREAKTYTRWLAPDKRYENALLQFVTAILTPGEKNYFLTDFQELHKFTSYHGALNSLAQVLLKITAPGLPDFYQGTELWDFSLVDPDNRRPVNFEQRASILSSLLHEEKKGDLAELARNLLASWYDGRVKMYLTYKALNFRRRWQGLFCDGEYIPLESRGRDRHVCAFARRLEDIWVLVAVPRLTVGVTGEPGMELEPPLGEKYWAQTKLKLPAESPSQWQNIFTGEEISASEDKDLSLAEVWRNFPVALCTSKKSG